MEKGKRPPTPGAHLRTNHSSTVCLSRAVCMEALGIIGICCPVKGGGTQGWRLPTLTKAFLPEFLTSASKFDLESSTAPALAPAISRDARVREARMSAGVRCHDIIRRQRGASYISYILHQHRCTGRHHWFRFRIGRIN